MSDVSFKRQLAAYYHQKFPYRTASDIGKELGFSSKWVKKWWNKNSTDMKLFQDGRKGRKIKTKVTPRIKHIIKRNMHGSRKVKGCFRRKLSQRQMVKHLKEKHQVIVCRATVGNVLKDYGLTYTMRKKKTRLTQSHLERRLKFAKVLVYLKFSRNNFTILSDEIQKHKKLKKTDWMNWINSDSSPFYLSAPLNKQNDGIYLKSGSFLNYFITKIMTN
jgi:transposase